MEAYDVIVLGTGAAGLTAAISAHDGGARVAVFEKGAKVGGTSAWSGGMVWIPMNRHMAELGIEDCREKVLTYVMSMSHGLMSEDLVGAFVDAGPEVIDYLEAKTPAQFQIIPGFPDHHPEHPGAARGRVARWSARCSPSSTSATGSSASRSGRSCPATS